MAVPRAGRRRFRSLHHGLGGLGRRLLHGQVVGRGMAAVGGLQLRGPSGPRARARKAGGRLPDRGPRRQRHPRMGTPLTRVVSPILAGPARRSRRGRRSAERRPRRMGDATGAHRLSSDSAPLCTGRRAAGTVPQRCARDDEQPRAAAHLARLSAPALRLRAFRGRRPWARDSRHRGPLPRTRPASSGAGLGPRLRRPPRPSRRRGGGSGAARDPHHSLPAPRSLRISPLRDRSRRSPVSARAKA